MEHDVTETPVWSKSSVIMTCVKYGLYKDGTKDEYNRMLDLVDKTPVDKYAILAVSEDISKHSDGHDLESVLFVIGNEAVTRRYVIK